MKKKLLSLICALICVCALSVSLVACNPGDTDSSAATFVSMDINPSIELTLDKNNNVLSVYAANEDAQVLLYGENGIVGVNVDVAVEKITQLAIDLGYINEDNKVVETSVTSVNGKTDEILTKINAKVTATAENLNMTVNCTGTEAYSLMRKLNNLKAQYPDNAAVQALTPEKLKVVISATETGEITFEAAVEMNDEALVKLISDAHAKAEQFATDTYKQLKSQAFAAYDKAVGIALDNVYAEYYLNPTNILAHPTTFYYGPAYQAYKTGARGLAAIADALAFVENACDTPLDKDQIAAISEALGLGEDVSALENSNGDITVKSVETYADKLFKNSKAGEELDKVKSELTAAINKTESEIQTAIDEMSKEYEAQITAATETFNTVKEMLSGYINPAVKEQIETIIADINDILDNVSEIISDGKITSDEVRELSDVLSDKANDTLNDIKADLSEEELATVNQKIADRENNLSSLKTEMDNTISQAEQSAKDYLANLKAQRTAA